MPLCWLSCRLMISCLGARLWPSVLELVPTPWMWSSSCLQEMWSSRSRTWRPKAAARIKLTFTQPAVWTTPTLLRLGPPQDPIPHRRPPQLYVWLTLHPPSGVARRDQEHPLNQLLVSQMQAVTIPYVLIIPTPPTHHLWPWIFNVSAVHHKQPRQPVQLVSLALAWSPWALHRPRHFQRSATMSCHLFTSLCWYHLTKCNKFPFLLFFLFCRVILMRNFPSHREQS